MNMQAVENGFMVEGQFIDSHTVRQMAAALDYDYYREDIMSRIEAMTGDEDFGYTLPKDLVDKLVQGYKANREDDESWIYCADAAIDQHSEEIEALFSEYENKSGAKDHNKNDIERD